MSYILMFLLSIPATIFGGFVLSQLWLWFLVPLGVSPIGIANAIGVYLLVSYMTTKIDRVTNPDMQGWLLFFTSFLATLFIWGFGALIHLFM